MPIYEYKCSNCGSKTEKIQSITSPPLDSCPKCGTTNGFRRVISTTSFILRGTGWYATDYRNRGKEKSSENK